MGLFLQKKKRSQHTKKQPTTNPKPWDPYRTLKGLKCLAATVIIVGLLIGWAHIEHYLTAYTLHHHAAPVTPNHVNLIDSPSWLNQALHDELRSLVATQISSDPFDNHTLQQAAFVLSNNPWIDRVQRIQRTSKNRVLVHATYREPVAIIEGRDGYHLVDHHGIRLPGLYLEHQIEHLKLPLIIGVAAAPRLEGEIWPGEDLQAGLALIQQTREQPYADQIHACDVGARDELGRINLILRTNSGGSVRWGLPPGKEQSIEPNAKIKRKRLAKVHEQRGAIDAGGKIVDLSGPVVFVHNPAYSTFSLPATYTWSR